MRSSLLRLAYPDIKFQDVSGSLKKVINSGWLTKGPKTEEFERASRRYLKVKEAIAVSSGTAALHLSLLSLGIGAGDEVVVPDFTFPAAANAVELCGAKAVLTDIERNDLNIDPEKIAGKITHKTRAIIAVHQFGNPAEMDRVMRVARKNNLRVIEDAACAFGARYRDNMCGSLGDFGCFSFHPRKIISTGEGGLVTTNDASLAKRCRRLREHGIEQTGAKRVFTSLGFNYRISEIASVIGLAQLSEIERIIAKRILLARKFREILSAVEGIDVIPKDPDKEKRNVYQSFIIAVKKELNIFDLISFLKSRNIEAAIANIAIHREPYYARKYNLNESDFVNSSWACEHCVALPFHTRMQLRDFIYIGRVLKDYLVYRQGEGK